MRRAVFFSMPLQGHMRPSLPLLEQLVRAGWEVTAVTSAAFEKAVEGIGCRFRAYAEPAVSEAGFDRGDWQSLVTASYDYAIRQIPHLTEQVQDLEPHLCLYDSMAPWGRAMARRLGRPTLSIFVIFYLGHGCALYDPCLLWQFMREIGRTGLPLRSLRERERKLMQLSGIKFSSMDVMASRGDQNVVLTSRLVHPSSWLFPRKRFCFLGSPYRKINRAPSRRYFSGHGKKIYVSLGTLFNENQAFFENCLEALDAGGMQAVVSLGARDARLPDLTPPPCVRIEPFVDQHAALAEADLFITHGGINSFTESMCAGVPVVAVPQQLEQDLVARRAERLGVGVRLKQTAPSAAVLREAITRVLRKPTSRARVATVRASLLEPSLAQFVERAERLAELP